MWAQPEGAEELEEEPRWEEEDSLDRERREEQDSLEPQREEPGEEAAEEPAVDPLPANILDVWYNGQRILGVGDRDPGPQDDDPRDTLQVSTNLGHVTIYHGQVRRQLFTPGAIGFPFALDRLRDERFTRCESRDQEGVILEAEIRDNWREQGSAPGPFGAWTGSTTFVFRGYPVPWERGAQQGPDPEPGEPSGGPPPLDDMEGDEYEVTSSIEEETAGEEPGRSRSPRRRAGGDGGPGDGGTLRPGLWAAARNYVETIDDLTGAGAKAWQSVRESGDALLTKAGTVEEAANALWMVREHLGRNNLQGVDDDYLREVLHPDHLDYMREIRHQGLPARYQGVRERVRRNPHPRARDNLPQVYHQLMKDVAKHRVLVASADHGALKSTVSSPFELVPKMLPNRTLSSESRLVHDQRQVNQGTDKSLHPPAGQPYHEQVARRILWLQAHYPGVDVLLAKKDVAGAFRLLWVAPQDVELFAGDVPWRPRELGATEEEAASLEGYSDLTLLYLVSSFGFSGSPGEWAVWGRATEEVHRNHRPQEARRDGAIHFCGKILVDDMILIEPRIGLRPWVSSEAYEWTVVKLLGEKAINKAKDLEEGTFESQQTVWGLCMDAGTNRMSLPEARILKGAYLLAQPTFNYGATHLTLRDLQRFRGVATGWAVVVPGLKNELRAADRFLGGVDGQAAISPKLSGRRDIEEAETQQAWEDLWQLFEDCRWMCARSETWSEKFGGQIAELLPPLERLSLPGSQCHTPVFVSSDSTLEVIAAIDWTHKVACREKMNELRKWIHQVVQAEGDDQKLAIHLGEMLSFVAFACAVGPAWTGKVVIYAGDNKIVYHWISGRRSGVRAGRLLVRVLNLVEQRYRCRILGGWWRTYHNEDSDALTRLDDEKAMEHAAVKGWRMVDIKEAIQSALEDTERFGACFLSWADQEDRFELMRLRELRLFRSIMRQPADLESVQVTEWCMGERSVKDFEHFSGYGQELRVVAGTIGPDPRGKAVRAFVRFLETETFGAAVLEGPREVAWDVLRKWAEGNGWKAHQLEYLTSELGEAMVRRRVALFLHQSRFEAAEIEGFLVKTVTPPSIGTCLKPGKQKDYIEYQSYEGAVNLAPEVMLPGLVGHVWFEDEDRRHSVYRLGGPCKWPLMEAENQRLQKLFVADKKAPTGTVRQLTPQEVWIAQGRTEKEWEALVEVMGETTACREGCRATGRRTALSLLGAVAELAKEQGSENKAGMCIDREDVKSLSALLTWLRRWRRGDFGRCGPD